MSWRRFLVLIRGLSPTSHWVLIHRSRAQGQVNRLSDPRAIESFFAGLATTKAVA